MQWGMQWNADHLVFSGIQNFQLRDLDAADFNIGNAANGQIRMSWIPLREPFTLSLPDSTTIMEICFMVSAEAPPGFQSVAFSNEVLTTEIYVDPSLYTSPVIQTPKMETGGIYIEADNALSLDVTIDTDPACGNTAGTITIHPLVGQAPFAYAWSGPNGHFPGGAEVSGLEPGLYSTTVADDNGVMAEVFSIVSIHGNPEPLDNFIRTVDITQATCGNQDGSITLNPDPIRTFTYLWSTGDTNRILRDVPAGTYTVEVTNITGCVQSYTYQISTLEGLEDLVRVQDQITCTNNTALIGVLPENDLDYTYSWSTGDTSNLITTELPGVYELTVTAGASCAETLVFVVEEPEIEVSFSRIDGTFGCNDTAVTIGLNLDQIPNGLMASWADGPTTFTRTANQPGLYQLTLVQGSCQRNFGFSVEEQDGGDLFYQRIETPFTCAGEPATIGVATSSDLNYGFTWSDTTSEAATLAVTEPGTYVLTISSGRCTTSESFVVTPFAQPEFSFAERLDDILTCDPNLPARIGFISRPQTDYHFNWNTGDSTSNIITNSQGNFAVTVTDGICRDSFFFQVALKPEKTYTRIEDQLSCSNPVATIGIIAEDPNIWEVTSANGNIPGGLLEITEPGLVTLNIVSNGRCSFTEEFNVTVANSSEFFTVLTDNLDCSGSDTVEIGLMPLPPVDSQMLSYVWSTGDTTPRIQVTQAGNYTVTVFNGITCDETYNIPVGTQGQSIAYERFQNQLNCKDPTVQIGVTNANRTDYQYSWSNGVQTSSLIISTPGTYQLTITDPISSCFRIETFVQNEPSIQDASITTECLTSYQCGRITAYQAVITDGTAPFIYRWNTGQTDTLSEPSVLLSGLSEPVAVTVTDNTGCMAILEAPASACLPSNAMDVRVYYACPEVVNAPSEVVAEVISGGVPPYIFNWNDGQRDSSYFLSRTLFSSGSPNTSVTVTDALGQSRTVAFNDGDAYGCTDSEDAPLTLIAPHFRVEPGQSFTYPIAAADYGDIVSSVYTIRWDPCLLRVDTIKMYGTGDTVIQSNFLGSEGSFEIELGGLDPTLLGDTTVVNEVIFTALDGFGVSPFLFSFSEPANGENNSDVPVSPVHGSVEVTSPQQVVTPGDANRDGQINHYDLLPIGLGIQARGPDRRLRLNAGQEFGYSWNTATPGRSINFKNLDANGDGIISGEDVEVIDRYWSGVTAPATPIGNTPILRLEGDSLLAGTENTFRIQAGTSAQPLIDAYGIAFTLTYAGLAIDRDSITLLATDNWMGADLMVLRSEPDVQKIYISLSRTDGQPITGQGVLAELVLSLPDGATGTLTVTLEDILLMDHLENFRSGLVETQTYAVETITSQHNLHLKNQITVFPNPSTERLNVRTTGLEIMQLEVQSLQGQVLVTTREQATIATGSLPTGLYLLRILTDEGMVALPFQHVKY